MRSLLRPPSHTKPLRTRLQASQDTHLRSTGIARGIPVIGISSYGVLNMRKRIESEIKAGNGRIQYRTTEKVPCPPDIKESKWRSVVLDANHTCHFLYDDGTEGMFGREVHMRTAFESEMRNTSCVTALCSPRLKLIVFSMFPTCLFSHLRTEICFLSTPLGVWSFSARLMASGDWWCITVWSTMQHAVVCITRV